MQGDYHAVIVGAGPAGSAAAVLLARRGRRVLLLDRADFPRPKLCTHAIMPAGLPVLDELGVLAQIEQAGAQRWYGARLWINGCRFAADFPTRKVAFRYGLSLRRDRLDAILLEAALNQPGVDVRTGAHVGALIRRGRIVAGVHIADGACREEVRAPLTILAGGRMSALIPQTGLPALVWPNRHTAYVAYVEGVKPEQRPGIEGFYWHGRSASLLPSDNGLRVAGIMVKPNCWPAGELGERLLAELRRFPPLRGRLHAARVVTRPICVRGLRSVWRSPAGPGLLLIGDAGVQTDPAFGQGISWALRSAAWAAAAADSCLNGDASALKCYARQRARVFGHRFLAMAAVAQLPPGSMAERLFAANATVHPPSTELILRGLLGFGTVSRVTPPRRTVATWLREAVCAPSRQGR